MEQWFPIVASTVLALIPVVIWINVIHRQGEEKSLLVKTFLLGTLAVVPPFILIFVFERFPNLNIYHTINRTVSQIAFAALLTNIVVGIVEEIAKNLIVRIIDKRHPEHLQTIGAVLKLSICAGLGFAFAENIFYFYNIWIHPQFGAADLLSTFVFRSMFTMLGHMVFSGIFGYYFGLGKFAADLTELARWQGQSLKLMRMLSRLTGRMTFEVLREQKNILGLFLAMAMHALFNASLELNYKLPAILIVIFGALYIWHLMQTKSGHLLLSIRKRRGSTMAPRDEDVVMELLGMCLKEGRFDEVMKICDRLLQRDPDNNVVKLFRAKAYDNQELRQFYGALQRLFKKHYAAVPPAAGSPGSTLTQADEKVVLEVLAMWYKEGNYKNVLEVAKRLLSRNPNSEGAKVLLEKAIDKEKLRQVFESLSHLFMEEHMN